MLIYYNVMVIVMKISLQFVGCVFMADLYQNFCWLLQLLGIGCLKVGSLRIDICLCLSSRVGCTVPFSKEPRHTGRVRHTSTGDRNFLRRSLLRGATHTTTSLRQRVLQACRRRAQVPDVLRLTRRGTDQAHPKAAARRAGGERTCHSGKG